MKKYASFNEYQAAKCEIINGVEYEEITLNPDQWGMNSKIYSTADNGNFYEVYNPNTGIIEFWSDKHPTSRYYDGRTREEIIVIGVANNGGAPNWSVSDAAYTSLIRLCVDICQRNGIVELVYDGTPNGSLTRHNMFSNQTCPGAFLQSRFGEIVSRVNNSLAPAPIISQPPVAITPPPVTNHEPRLEGVADWAAKAWLWAIESLNMDGNRPNDPIRREEAMTLLHRLYNLMQN